MAGSDEPVATEWWVDEEPKAPGIYVVKANDLRPLDVLDEGLRIRKVTQTQYSDGHILVRAEAGHDEVVEEDLGANVVVRNESTGAEFPAQNVKLRRVEWKDLREVAFRADERVRIARGVPPGVGSGFLGSPWRSGPDEGLSRLRPSSAEDELLQ